MDEQHVEDGPAARRPAATPILVQDLPAWPLTATLAVLAVAVAILLLAGVPAGL